MKCELRGSGGDLLLDPCRLKTNPLGLRVDRRPGLGQQAPCLGIEKVHADLREDLK
jgi:hypothetical protein